MKDLFLSELKCIYNEHQFTEEEKQILLNEANRLYTMSEIVRKEGLLSLSALVEGSTWELDGGENLSKKYGILTYSKKGFENYIAELIEIVIDGTDADIILNIGELNLCTAGLRPEEYIRYLMAIDTILQIKFGLVPYMVKKIIAAYLPAELKEIF